MTEEDTFRTLKKPPIREMVVLFNEWLDKTNLYYTDIGYVKSRNEFFKIHAWTFVEFEKAIANGEHINVRI